MTAPDWRDLPWPDRFNARCRELYGDAYRECSTCGRPLLLLTPGREICERCRLHPEETP